MKNKPLTGNDQSNAAKKSNSTEKESIQNNPDMHIDQDFKGYPHGTASEEVINPKTKQEKKVAATDTKDGEKIIDPQNKKKNKLTASETDEENTDGSANAFDATERVKDNE